MRCLTRVLLTTAVLFLWHVLGDSQTEKDQARELLKYMNGYVCKRYKEDRQYEWDYESNITEENLNRMTTHSQIPFLTPDQNFSWASFNDPDMLRQARKYGLLGLYSDEELERLEALGNRNTELINNMTDMLNNLVVCDYYNRSDCTLDLDGGISDILATSEDPTELMYYWTQTTDTIGKEVRDMYAEYIQISNQVAQMSNFSNMGEKWIAENYEMGLSEFEKQMDDMWTQLEPLYLQIHAYVRKKLYNFYGGCVVNRTGPIPGHILGNIWASHWENVYERTIPFPNKPSIDVTPEMKKQKFTMKKIMDLVEDFYVSINMSAMTKTFRKYTILEKPKDREVVCAGSAYDFYDGEDFRILYCGTGNMDDLFTIYHETGHIEYFMAYSDQPCCYRDGANGAFHEAVGDAIGLSVSTIKHLQRLGLLQKGIEDDEELQINSLYRKAIEKVAFLQYGLVVDKYRWALFRGDISPDKMNSAWWKMRYDIGGISPPVPRTERSLDVATKVHVVNNVQYIDYYIGTLLECQFHGALCTAAGEYDPKHPGNNTLSNCDIYGSAAAGNLLKGMLEMGSSKPWPVALEAITGQRVMDAKALVDYYRPLYLWLVEENKKTGEKIGWK